MQALVFERKPARYAAAAVASRVVPGAGGGVGPLRRLDIDPPEVPGPGWHTVRPRLTGICGSDLATVEGRSSRYFEPLVSFPFVPGHEVVGLDETGRRVALEPVLGPAARDEPLPFPGAAPGDGLDYGYLLGGAIDDGIQIGFCASTGGGWGEALVAHQSQLHEVPDDLSDEAAVMLEPAAGGVHAALKAHVQPGASVAVLGAGTMGLCSVAAVRALTEAGTVLITAKYPHQRDLADSLGADIVVEPREARRAVRRFCGCRMLGDYLSGGVDVTIDAVGSPTSVADAIAITRPRGRIVLLGMPEAARLDLTGLWHRETEMVGAYTYGTETLPGDQTATSFAMAFDLVVSAELHRLVSARYPLERYREAITHAAEAGARGAVKVVFEQNP
ncbi:zinc-dependent alcohol dehydrogenase [Candidatus Poriferisocius sp.]|uniref:zinc-dependent alcohol dehydrogenase n=1 Tax=Candidatus Poriferisocius sp. TaxID=3101276 RepID=UPI003B5B68EB